MYKIYGAPTDGEDDDAGGRAAWTRCREALADLGIKLPVDADPAEDLDRFLGLLTAGAATLVQLKGKRKETADKAPAGVVMSAAGRARRALQGLARQEAPADHAGILAEARARGAAISQR